MLYKHADDFFKQAAAIKRLSREEEKECARKMKSGDESARQMIINSYLPLVASCAKRYFSGDTSLELIYRFLNILESSVDSFNFENDNYSFMSHLSSRFRQEAARFIVDSK